jgi:hypothetical protein
MSYTRKKKTRKTETYLGGRDQRTDGRKGVTGRKLE